MSRLRLCLCALQQSFFDEYACRTMLESNQIAGDDSRPWKRRKIDADEAGWATIIEFIVECQLVDESSTCTGSSAPELVTSPVNANITFDNPIMTVSNPITDQPVFAFVCQETEVSHMERILWYQRLMRKDPSIGHCIRLSSSLSMRRRHETIQSSTVSFRVEIRFDQNLLQVAKLSLKDRLAILDYAFGKPSTEVTADLFYANIGKLPKDYVQSENEESLQHLLITCRLFPFQKRAVAWMLQREGISFHSNSGGTVDKCELPPLWETVRDLDHRILYINRHQAFSTLDQNWLSDTFIQQSILGGILAEVCTSCPSI